MLLAQTVIYMNDNQDNWDLVLASIERDINAAVNHMIGRSQFEPLYRYQPKFVDSIFQ